MYQWLPIILIALHTWNHTAHNGLPAKNRNHVIIPGFKNRTMEAR